MNAPDPTPGPGVRDAVLRRGRTLRHRRQAAWASAGAALTVLGVVAGGAVVGPEARRADVVSPIGTTTPPPGTPSPEPTPTSPTASPSASPLRPSTKPSPTATPTRGQPWTPWTIPPDDAEPEVYRDDYLDDRGTRRAYPAAYGTCSYSQQESDPTWVPDLRVSASDPRLVDKTLYVTVTMTNTGTTTLDLTEQTMVPMDALFRGDVQVTGTGTFFQDNEIRHALGPGESFSAVHRLHAVACRDPGTRERTRLPAGEYRLRAAVVVYPGEGREGGPIYADPITVTLP